MLVGASSGAAVGNDLAAGGELTGDIYPDLLISALGETRGGTADGVVWVIPGGP